MGTPADALPSVTPRPLCVHCPRGLPAVLWIDHVRQTPVGLHKETEGYCAVCIFERLDAIPSMAAELHALVQRATATPPAPAPAPAGMTPREREEMNELRALVEQLRAEVADAVALARSARAPPAP